MDDGDARVDPVGVAAIERLRDLDARIAWLDDLIAAARTPSRAAKRHSAVRM
jgi:hypothetical protein